eukprot:scaffold602_cov298-Pinguiococcus_pyrenoidosus.AAC.14
MQDSGGGHAEQKDVEAELYAELATTTMTFGFDWRYLLSLCVDKRSAPQTRGQLPQDMISKAPPSVIELCCPMLPCRWSRLRRQSAVHADHHPRRYPAV